MNDKAQFCQSCGMPMQGAEDQFGTEADGSVSKDYCNYCYENGAFTFHGTMEEMIDICIPPMVEANPGMTNEQARKIMEQFLPSLKRWKV